MQQVAVCELDCQQNNEQPLHKRLRESAGERNRMAYSLQRRACPIRHSLFTVQRQLEKGMLSYCIDAVVQTKSQIQNTSHVSRRSRMCFLEETYHVPCGHWGSKINRFPCSRAIGHNGLRQGCWNANVDGVVRLDTECIACHRRQARTSQDSAWNPLSDISSGAWRQINERMYRRRLGFQEYYPWMLRREVGNRERRRYG